MKNTLIIIFGAVLMFFSSCKDQPRDNDCVDRSKIDKSRACYNLYNPVCGCDNITYSNDCEAKKNGVTRFTKGKCKRVDDKSDCIDRSKIDKSRACYNLYDPVCGCDNITYSNDCEAKKNGVTRFTKGECGKEENREVGHCDDVVPKDEACQAYFQRWFYNRNRNQCEMISYSGCSQKGFATQKDCEKCKDNRM